MKEPYVLEFMGIRDNKEIAEKDVENAIISNLQKFLLELGRGVALWTDRCVFAPKHLIFILT